MPDRIDAADFVDAHAPDAGLQRAVDAVPPGGMLALPADTFVLRRSVRLKSNMTLAGVGAETMLTIRPEPPCVRLATDAREGERVVTAVDARGFEPGMEITIRDGLHTGWYATFAVVAAVDGNRLVLDAPLVKDYAAARGAQAVGVFPALRALDADNLVIRGLRIVGHGPVDGLIPHNVFVQSAVHLRNGRGALIAGCTVERWHADGFSVQGGADARVMECAARGNAGHGFHPGTGLQDSFWSGNLGEWNGGDGLYYCASCRRVVASRNRFFRNFRHGIGGLGDGGDRDCLVAHNLCERNGGAGVATGRYGECRNNFIVDNRLIANAQALPGPAVLLEGTGGNVVARNDISDPQVPPREVPTQVVGIEEDVDTDGNFIVANAIQAARAAVRLHGAHTLTADAFPGPHPRRPPGAAQRPPAPRGGDLGGVAGAARESLVVNATPAGEKR